MYDVDYYRTAGTAPYPYTTYIGDPQPLTWKPGVYVPPPWTPASQKHTPPGTDTAFCPACIEQVEKEGSCTCRLGGSEHVGDSGAEHVAIEGDRAPTTYAAPTGDGAIPSSIIFTYSEPYCPEEWEVSRFGIQPSCTREHVHNFVAEQDTGDFLHAIYGASYGQG